MLQLDARGDLTEIVHTSWSARSCTPPRTTCARHRARGPDPSGHPAPHRRRLHPRPLLLAGCDDLPDPARDGLLVGPRPRRAGGTSHGRRGVGDRHPLDLLARPLHHPRPALGPGRRDLRRGPAPHRRARRGDDPRLPGRRPHRPDGRSSRAPSTSPATPRPRAAATRARPTSAVASCVVVPAALRASRAGGLPHLHARLPGDRRRPRHGERVAPRRGAQGGVGLHRHPRHRLGQRRSDGLGAEGLRRRRRGRDGRGPRRQRPRHDDPGLLRGRPGGRRARPARRARHRRGRPPGAARQARAGTLREPAAAGRRAPARRHRLRRARRPQPRRRPPLARAPHQRRHAPVCRHGRPAHRGRPRAERRRPAGQSRRLGRRLRPGRLDARRSPARDGRDRARRLPRRRPVDLGRHPCSGRRDRDPRARPRGAALPRRPAPSAGLSTRARRPGPARRGGGRSTRRRPRRRRPR